LFGWQEGHLAIKKHLEPAMPKGSLGCQWAKDMA